MFKHKLFKAIYKMTDSGSNDAKLLFDALGDKEAIETIVSKENISKGKWEDIFNELILLLDEDDIDILESAYLKLTKRGIYDILWTGFAHHAARREANKPNPMKEMVKRWLAEAEEAEMDMAALSDLFQQEAAQYQQEFEASEESIASVIAENQEEMEEEAVETAPSEHKEEQTETSNQAEETTPVPQTAAIVEPMPNTSHAPAEQQANVTPIDADFASLAGMEQLSDRDMDVIELNFHTPNNRQSTNRQQA